MKPEDIEKQSMRIIRSELGATQFDDAQLSVVLRAIHTTADFDFAQNMVFSPDAVAIGRRALTASCPVITDTQMAAAGVSKPSAARFSNELVCKMGDPEIAASAAKRGVTRAEAAMDWAAKRYPEGALFAIGNAPTALLRLCELVERGELRPALVIGVPVGFVNVVESKQALLALKVPYIVAKGRKGGSTVAAAIINALYYGIEA